MYNRRRDSFLPFLLLVVVGTMLVLAVRFIGGLFFDGENDDRSFVVSQVLGSSKMFSSGEESWDEIKDGEQLWHGDILRTDEGARLEVNLNQEVYVRLADLSELKFSDVSSFDGVKTDKNVVLLQGTAWVNNQADQQLFSFQVDAFVIETFKPSIFQVKFSEDSLAFDVFKGRVGLSYFAGINPIMRFSLSEGTGATFPRSSLTQIVLGQKGYQDFLRGVFEEDFPVDWITWNRGFDVALDKSEVSKEIKPVTQIAVLFPEDGVTISEDTLEIRGLAPLGSHDIVVYHFVGESVESYRLRKFLAGDKEWRYTAALGYGNLIRGENRYKIVALDELGNEISSVELKVLKE